MEENALPHVLGKKLIYLYDSVINIRVTNHIQEIFRHACLLGDACLSLFGTGGRLFRKKGSDDFKGNEFYPSLLWGRGEGGGGILSVSRTAKFA